MHYKNGREAHNGDKIVWIPAYGGLPVVGILYDAAAGNDACNGRLAPASITNPMPNLAECLHLEDVLSALNPPKTDVPAGPVPPIVNTQGQPVAGPAPADPPGESHAT